MTTSVATTVRNTRRPGDAPARDPMQEFANRIIAELENGVKPWVRPWDTEKAGGPQAPFNPVTGKRYHGINVLILGMDMRAFPVAMLDRQQVFIRIRGFRCHAHIFVVLGTTSSDSCFQVPRRGFVVSGAEIRGFRCQSSWFQVPFIKNPQSGAGG